MSNKQGGEISSAYAALIDCTQINVVERLWMCVCTKVQSLLVIYGSIFTRPVPVDAALFIIYKLYQTRMKMVIFLTHPG